MNNNSILIHDPDQIKFKIDYLAWW